MLLHNPVSKRFRRVSRPLPPLITSRDQSIQYIYLACVLVSETQRLPGEDDLVLDRSTFDNVRRIIPGDGPEEIGADIRGHDCG